MADINRNAVKSYPRQARVMWRVTGDLLSPDRGKGGRGALQRMGIKAASLGKYEVHPFLILWQSPFPYLFLWLVLTFHSWPLPWLLGFNKTDW